MAAAIRPDSSSNVARCVLFMAFILRDAYRFKPSQLAMIKLVTAISVGYRNGMDTL